MGKYCDQGSKTRDLGNGVVAPIDGRGGAAILKDAKGGTTGKVGMAGIGKNGVPIKGGK